MNTQIEETQTIATLLTPAQMAKMLGVGEATLAVWRCTRRYALRYVKVGRSVRYRLNDVNRFLESRVHGGDERRERKRRRG